jgi:hypothetical protein
LADCLRQFGGDYRAYEASMLDQPHGLRRYLLAQLGGFVSEARAFLDAIPGFTALRDRVRSMCGADVSFATIRRLIEMLVERSSGTITGSAAEGLSLEHALARLNAPASPTPRPSADAQAAGATPALETAHPDIGQEAAPRVVLRGRDKPPLVLGREKAPLTDAQYDVVEALLKAGNRGLSKDRLTERSGRADSLGALRRLQSSDPDWAAVIHFPGRPGGGYRIG